MPGELRLLKGNHSQRYRIPFDLEIIGRAKFPICLFEISELVPNNKRHFADILESRGLSSTFLLEYCALMQDLVQVEHIGQYFRDQLRLQLL